MARWMLMEPHYINVPGTFWEQMQTDRETGRSKRVQIPVPLHLDPKSPSDWNYKSGGPHVSQGGKEFSDGAIIVCWEGKGEPKDIVFLGAPTPGMEPIDDEAKAESEKYATVWNYDPFSISDDPTATFANHLIKQASVMESAQAQQAQQNAEAMAQMKDLLAMMAQVMQQNTQLLTQLANAKRV